jgi:hypothetical protein
MLDSFLLASLDWVELASAELDTLFFLYLEASEGFSVGGGGVYVWTAGLHSRVEIKATMTSVLPENHDNQAEYQEPSETHSPSPIQCARMQPFPVFSPVCSLCLVLFSSVGAKRLFHMKVRPSFCIFCRRQMRCIK